MAVTRTYHSCFSESVILEVEEEVLAGEVDIAAQVLEVDVG